MDKAILVEIDGAIAIVTMNRPERRNSMLVSMVIEMAGILGKLAKNDAIRVLILRGAGHDFCPGADLGVTASGEPTGTRAMVPEDYLTPVLLHEMPAITIAAIEGACAGAGLGWALGCDLRFASPSARFNTAFLDVGVAGDMGGPWSLSRIVGPAKARELYFLPGKFDAAEAHRIGLVSRVFSDATIQGDVRAIAERLAASAPLALKAMKAHFVAAESMSFREFVLKEAEKHMALFRTQDTMEAFRAKVEKRLPKFEGR